MAVWRRANNWTYEVFERNATLEQFGVFESLAALWRAKRDVREMPSWADFDFYDFKGLHGVIAVQDVVTDPFDLRCRLWGIRLVEIFGSDYTGMLYSKIRTDYTKNDVAFFTELCRLGSIGMCHGKLDWPQNGDISAGFIDLPLSDDGSAVSHFSTVFTEIYRDHDDRSHPRA